MKGRTISPAPVADEVIALVKSEKTFRGLIQGLMFIKLKGKATSEMDEVGKAFSRLGYLVRSVTGSIAEIGESLNKLNK